MAFVSFPHMDFEESMQSQSLYGKMYTAATSMFGSRRSDENDGDSQEAVTPGAKSTPGHSRAPSFGNAMRPSPRAQSPDQTAPVPIGRQGPQVASNSIKSGASGASTPPYAGTHAPLLRTSTTSSATVGVTAEQAVPLLPTTNNGSTSISNLSLSRDQTPSLATSPAQSTSVPEVVRPVDVESLFSVSSTSASRAYLSSQYTRSRSRAAPGRLGREFWMKDESATSCFSCNRAFTTFRRKHHCRVCGQIFCSACTDLVDGERFGVRGRRVRCCRSCEDALAGHSSSDDEPGDVSYVSQAQSQQGPDDSLKWPEIVPHLDADSVRQENEDGDYDEDELHSESYSRMASPSGKEDLHLARSFLGAPHFHQTRHSRSRSLTHYMRDDESSISRIRSPSFGTLAPVQASNPTSPSSVPLAASPVLTSTLSTAAAAAGSLGPVGLPSHTSNLASAHLLHSNEDYPMSFARFPNAATVDLNNAALTYFSLFLDQLLKDSELDPLEWNSVLTTPLLQVASGLHLELNDRVSPREWVKIKKIPGGTAHDIDYITGTVFTHSLARTSMARRLRLPRILLIAFPIEYSRNDRYMSLEPVVAQEKEYLRKLVARIVGLQPSLLVTCSHVCGQAMDMLEAAGVAVAQRVSEHALFHVSKVTRGDVLTSIDRLSAAPRLGTCELFEVRSYRYASVAKTFLFFFVKPSDPGRCALVRGDPEIASVIKVVMEVMVDICYSLKAETALMRDQFVLVPALKDPPEVVLSSSPFVDYGTPYLQKLSHLLEDEVVALSNNLSELKDPLRRHVVSSRLDTVRNRWLEATHLWESIERASPYMFNPSSHQNILVLYSLVLTSTATPCIGPEQQLIEFYLSTDQTIGQFVEGSIGQAHEACPDDCGHSYEQHHRVYVNGNGCVTVHLEPTPCKIPGLQDSILMWSYCKKCDLQMTVVPMSSTTWKYSLGKYLELSFYGEPLRMRASTCDHNVYRDHIRFFGWHDYALRIEYSSVDLNDIYGPPKGVRWNPEAEIDLKKTTFAELDAKLKRFWSSLLDSLSKVTIEGLDEDKMKQSQQRLVDMRKKAESDDKECSELLGRLYAESAPNDYLSLNKILEFYQRLVDQWHQDFADFDGQFFPTERDIRRVTAQHLRGLLGEDPEKPRGPQRRASSIAAKEDDALPPSPQQGEKSKKNTGTSDNATDKTPERLAGNSENAIEPGKPDSSARDALTVPASAPTTSSLAKFRGKPNQQRGFSISHNNDEGEANLERDNNGDNADQMEAKTPPGKTTLPHPGLSPSSVRVKSKFGNDINLSMPGFNPGSIKEGEGRVSILARHFEELSREFEIERQREKQRLKDRQRAIDSRYAQPVAEVFEEVSDAIEDWPGQSKSDEQKQIVKSSNSSGEAEVSGHAQGNRSLGEAERASVEVGDDVAVDDHDSRDIEIEDDAAETIKGIADAAIDSGKEDDEVKKAEPVKVSLIRTLANFWAERSSTRWNGIEYVLDPRQHFFANSLVVLRETEPSSLIAFCLSLPDYQSRVNDFYVSTPGVPKSLDADDDFTLEQAMLRQTGTHMRYHFGRDVRVSCKIFFSEQFDALRRKCMRAGEFIQSLSRCNPWESLGGKSGLAFLKTLDDRFILKELSNSEFDSFVSFAPSYFEYMAQALFHDLPTVLAKIFGVYQITIRNSSQTSQQVKMYVLVMENLFYGGAKFSKFFDLKGSLRNRKVTETGRENEVLLDENMVEYIYESPVFVREHSKRMLRASLYNDTLFLTKMNIMDYSLVIGLDEDRKLIVAGIIDYIRAYTWDKKIESWVKAKAAVGIKEPTVVSPRQYKGRFRESMERYFLMVPDCWSQPSL